MTRLKKELMNRGIIYDVQEDNGYDPYEAEAELVGIFNDFIITCYCCNVLEPIFHIYDRNFNYIGQQSTEKSEYFFNMKTINPWSVAVYNKEEEQYVI